MLLVPAAWPGVILPCVMSALTKPQPIRRVGWWWLAGMETDHRETRWWHCLPSAITKSLMEVRTHCSLVRLPSVLPPLWPKKKNASWRRRLFRFKTFKLDVWVECLLSVVFFVWCSNSLIKLSEVFKNLIFSIDCICKLLFNYFFILNVFSVWLNIVMDFADYGLFLCESALYHYTHTHTHHCYNRCRFHTHLWLCVTFCWLCFPTGRWMCLTVLWHNCVHVTCQRLKGTVHAFIDAISGDSLAFFSLSSGNSGWQKGESLLFCSQLYFPVTRSKQGFIKKELAISKQSIPRVLGR